MATISALKAALRQISTAAAQSEPCESPPQQISLSDMQYSAGFDALIQSAAQWATYQDFIVPQLSQVLSNPRFSGGRLSVLEIGPGPSSVLGQLPFHLRSKIREYAAFEPNKLFKSKLWSSLVSSVPDPQRDTEHEHLDTLPGLEYQPKIRPVPFLPYQDEDSKEMFDVIFFCHSMYGMQPKTTFIARALSMLKTNGVVVVFHRDNLAQHLDRLVCHRTASWPTGTISVADEDSALDAFAPFVAGFAANNAGTQDEWRKTCRSLGSRGALRRLTFCSPEVMLVFNKHAATALDELAAEGVPMVFGQGVDYHLSQIKNREARLHRPVCIMTPHIIPQVQECVRWALKNDVGLTVIGGGHSGQCVWPNVVAIDLAAFNRVRIEKSEVGFKRSWAFVKAGCKTVDVVCEAAANGLSVPLGSRPSVGAGLWLQGGIGHQSRAHGLTCDNIVGAVMVSVATGQVFGIGDVPYPPEDCEVNHSANEGELLWAIRGAGTNFSIILSVTLKAYAAPNYSIRSWVVTLDSGTEAHQRLEAFDKRIASQLPSTGLSVDAFLYWDAGELQLGVSKFDVGTSELLNISGWPQLTASAQSASMILEQSRTCVAPDVDGIRLFDEEMYMSEMRGGHGCGKTSAFKCCVFLKDIGSPEVATGLVSALRKRPCPMCYFHMLHGGGTVLDIPADTYTFGCQDWDFTCVITGVWPRDGTDDDADAVVRWVYEVAQEFLKLGSLCRSVYGADLGPDPRDAPLAALAFGPNQQRLARLKREVDPCAGKDFCADIWANLFARNNTRDPDVRGSLPTNLTARVSSISDTTKREYAASTAGVDLDLLPRDRAYKKHHRPALTAFYPTQFWARPRLPQDHVLAVIADVNTDVLFITGMREDLPVSTFVHLVPESMIVEVRVRASTETRTDRRGCDDGQVVPAWMNVEVPASRPNLVFTNDELGPDAAEAFARRFLFPLLYPELHGLAAMVRVVPGFPRPGVAFRHVLGIAEQRGGLDLRSEMIGDCHSIMGVVKVQAVACCEAGGFVFAPGVATRLGGVPLLVARAKGKLPPPTVSVEKVASYVSKAAGEMGGKSGGESGGQTLLEMSANHGLPSDASVVVIDDVLAMGETLVAVLQLLVKAGIDIDRISVWVVAEFPIHRGNRGRNLLCERGFGRIDVQSLLVYGGV